MLQKEALVSEMIELIKELQEYGKTIFEIEAKVIENEFSYVRR